MTNFSSYAALRAAAEHRWFNDPEHHARVTEAVNAVQNAVPSRLTDADRSLATLAASIALVIAEVPIPSRAAFSVRAEHPS